MAPRNNEITPSLVIHREAMKATGVMVPRPGGCGRSWMPTKDPGTRACPCCPQPVASLWRGFCLAISPWVWLTGQEDGTIPEAGCVVWGKPQAPTQVIPTWLGFEDLAVGFCVLSFNGEWKGRVLTAKVPVNEQCSLCVGHTLQQ